jgi:nucleoside-diphosphate-sugar epimerase
MRVLVTGGTSLLGEAVARQLAHSGHHAVLFQRSPSRTEFEEQLGDIADPDAARRAASSCDAVIHLAARVSIVGEWAEFERVNVTGTRNLLTAAHEAGADRFVHISTPSAGHFGASIVGGRAERADPERARGHYARSKAQAELLALEHASDTFSVVAIRPHLVWGPGDTQLVGRIVDRARSGRLAMIGGGLALIDTTYIDNAASAITAALERAPHVSGRSFVVSNGEPRTVYELVARILRAAGLPMPTLDLPKEVARSGGWLIDQVWNRVGVDSEPPITGFLVEQLTTAHWFDQRETREALGWEPHIPLEQGFDRLANWFSSQQ